ncbi:hypothetical protein BaRGS_00000716 [Batillaria attramentaria]|uniref:Myb/SANT-like DNA-binding domain-containing protein n=1 Tax=Batillaria attramentaria TaxID=370345 RepID=A0ABD0M8P7_9CAEN
MVKLCYALWLVAVMSLTAQDGNFYARELIQDAQQTFGLQLSSSTLVKIIEGGIGADQEFEDGTLYKPEDLDSQESQPAASHCVGSQPLSSQPLSSQPLISQPSSSQPLISQPSSSQPSSSQPLTQETLCSVRWSHENVLLLIELYRQHRHMFCRTTMKKKDVWRVISQELAKKGVNVSSDMAEKKFSNLKLRHKAIVDNNSATGRANWRWPYYDLMSEVLADDHSVTPPITVSSRSGIKVNTSTEPATPQRPETQQAEPPATASATSRTPGGRKRHRPDASALKECLSTSHEILRDLLKEEKRKNDILEKLVDKLS